MRSKGFKYILPLEYYCENNIDAIIDEEAKATFTCCICGKETRYQIHFIENVLYNCCRDCETELLNSLSYEFMFDVPKKEHKDVVWCPCDNVIQLQACSDEITKLGYILGVTRRFEDNQWYALSVNKAKNWVDTCDDNMGVALCRVIVMTFFINAMKEKEKLDARRD